MPEMRTKTIDTYDRQGRLVASEPIAIELSDEALAKEEAEKTISELDKASETGLTLAEVVRFLKALAVLRR